MGSANGPIAVTDSDFDSVVLKSPIPVLVDFWAVWCGPCRMIAPFVDEIARDYGDSILVAKLDTDANPKTSIKLGVMGIPTVIVFKDGKEIDRQVGVPRQPKETFKAKLDKALHPAGAN
jgi:thioredoxin 1